MINYILTIEESEKEQLFFDTYEKAQEEWSKRLEKFESDQKYYSDNVQVFSYLSIDKVELNPDGDCGVEGKRFFIVDYVDYLDGEKIYNQYC